MKDAQKAPGPIGFERLRILQRFAQEPLLVVLQLWQRYGDVIRIPMVTSSIFIISHPDHVGQIFRKSRLL